MNAFAIALLPRNTRKTECGAIFSWLGLVMRAAPFALLSCGGIVAAQSTATLAGKVQDPQRAFVAGAKLTLYSPDR